jgi:putative transposase
MPLLAGVAYRGCSLTRGSYFPSLLEPRRRIEKALYAVVTEAYVKGISTRKVDDLVKALGIDGISKSEVSRVCRALDKDVHAFRSRPIEIETPYVWLDATYHKVRENVGADNERVISVAIVVAVGVTASGERTVLGVDCGPSEDHVFWTHFLRSLVKRGLKGVQLIISDAHEGLRQAVAKVLSEASWQRCRVHFMRNLLSLIPRDAQGPVATLVRMIFAEPDHASAMAKLREVVRALQTRFPQAAELLEDAAEDLLFPPPFPTRAPAPAAFDQPARAAPQGDQEADPGRRHLPEPSRAAASRRDLARRTGRRMAGRGPSLLQRRIDAEDRRTRRR